MNKKQFNFILQKGEGQFIEFKENLNKSFAKEIVAFANASGGKIFLGVNDNGGKKGINITNKIKSKIQDIANQCDPSIIVNLNVFDNILIVDVKEGQNKPYSCKEGFYMR
ncbi:MAG: ATP-binding protein, partial [Patescibacteria group bacterium]|nr:ATP-binding protein [Patescibacteria group bacterium]